ncbi:hypothetical protein SAMN04515667_1893 [Formosa sp. Hel1_31_208]|uniref:hypothetical protein n=1 Tax=Formosa sp. Hel1_31_208 TaxID=1798225 RepID=UPI00087A310F|nr:hypothetical protein [Formosa sp. Hel1_31_208]SDS31393.1 hypothetical protein SAMN04515667_1893 [Formosa sp. Hel1_31_208]
MKRLLITLLLGTVLSCSKDPQTFVEFVDGYWEIEEVTMSNGLKKEYNYNDTIDYIQLTDSLSGVRRKLKPNLMGKFESSQSVESFRIKIENDSLNVYYTTPYADWKETILDASQTHLLVVNTNKDVYLYKRYEPLDLD